MADKAIFLDRDDTLIEDSGYISDPEQVKLLPGVAEALAELKAMKYKLVVVSNQSGVARGIVTEKVLGQIHDRLKQILTKKGVYLDNIYYCPDHPDGVIAKYRKESDWRKPGSGMLLAAAEEMNIDLCESWMIGDSSRDIEAGKTAGCKSILIDNPSRRKPVEYDDGKPDFKAVNMKEAVNIIKKELRTPVQKQPEANETPDDSVKPQANEKVASAELPQPLTNSLEKEDSGQASEELLGRILEELKKIQRDDMFSEFSIMRLMAVIVQVIVLFCLVICVWILLDPAGQNNSALIALGFAAVLQVMALTFYIMHGSK